MATEASFTSSTWEDPDGLAARMEEFSESLARCESLEPVGTLLPRTRADFIDIGVSGIEFAAFTTRHSSGLGSDLAELRSADAVTRPGRVYRVDGKSLFTQLDIAEPLPFEAGCVDWVYAEHLIEHVPLPVGIGWLTEVRRILAPGGVVRITTPDLHKYAQSYLNDDGFFARHRRRLRLMRVGPPMPERKAFMVNQIFYLYGHRWIYDLAELRHVLAAAGFAPGSVRLCSFRNGVRQDVADLDTSFRSDETIYVEATA